MGWGGATHSSLDLLANNDIESTEDLNLDVVPRLESVVLSNLDLKVDDDDIEDQYLVDMEFGESNSDYDMDSQSDSDDDRDDDKGEEELEGESIFKCNKISKEDTCAVESCTFSQE